MRWIAGAFGLICGAVVVALVGRYGFITSDNETNGMIAAFLFAVIAAGGLFGHAFAVHLWRTHKLFATVVGIVCTAALIVNLSNSLGAIAGRGDKTQAERAKIAESTKDDRATLESKMAERAKLQFTPTSSAAVDAAQSLADSAKEQRVAECGAKNETRGPKCQLREADEQAALTALTKATTAKASTDLAAKLDQDIAATRARLDAAPAVQKVNVQGAALASLFRLPDSAADDAASWQQFATAAIVELLILCSFIAFELLSPARVVVQVLPPVAHPRALKLVSPPDPAQAVLKFLSERVPRAKGSEANWSDITGALPVWWARQGLAGDPPSDAQLESILRRVSDQCDMPMRKRGGRAYFVGRKLA